MLKVFVCEDNPVQLEHITSCIRNYITIENLLATVALATDSPNKIINYLENNRVPGMYFLDLYIKNEMNGIELATVIRKYDPRGFIVFITVDEKSRDLTFIHGVEAMDYIVKGSADCYDRIRKCLLIAHTRYVAKATPLQLRFAFKSSKDNLKVIDFSEICYFKLSDITHKIELYTDYDRYIFRSSLAKLEQELSENFFRCSRCAIVNINKIVSIDAKKSELKLENGDTVEVVPKYIGKIGKLMRKTSSIRFWETGEVYP